MPRFIVAYDGSEPARAAFGVSLALAARTAGRPGPAWHLLLLHVIEPSPDAMLAESPAVALDPMMPPHIPMGLPSSLKEAQARQRAWIDSEAAGLRAQAQARAVPFDTLVDIGSLLDVLEDTAAPDDILAIGATGRFRRGGVGSTTKALVRNAACPLLVVDGPGSGYQPPTEITALACAFDATGSAGDAVSAGQRLAAATGLPLQVLAVPRSGSGAKPQDAAAVAAAASAAAPGASVINLAAGAPGPSITEAGLLAAHIRAHSGTLLIMGAYADSWIRELVLGSTTAQLLGALAGPVLLVHDNRGASPVTAD
jgi:nucleotide-binding universal stress UspA family protein